MLAQTPRNCAVRNMWTQVRRTRRALHYLESKGSGMSKYRNESRRSERDRAVNRKFIRSQKMASELDLESLARELGGMVR